MSRVYNFSAGPSMLPEAVLRRAAAEMLDYQGSGQSVMEMSHRSNVYEGIIAEAESLLRELMRIPSNYKILFLQGGASSQFAMVPLNLMTGSGKADYVLTGQWATKAYKEAARYGDARVVASSKDKTFSYIPELDPDTFTKDADYFHICMNNTIYGTVYHELPQTGDVPLVADISSCFLSRPLDVSRFGLLYAGAQKNLAPAGLTLIIVRDDLIGHAQEITPTMFNYQIHADNGSMFNTPPCYTIYIAMLVLRWLKNEIGGLDNMYRINRKKADLLYNYLDSSARFHGTVVPKDRSLMNAPFVTGNEELDAKFVRDSAAAGFVNLKGHRTVGGMRASIYNAMPAEGVEKLVAFMFKIVLPDCQTVTNGDLDLSMLERFGQVEYYPLTRRDQLARRITDADAVLCNKAPIDAETLCFSDRLEYVGLFATGYNNVDLAETNRRGITVCNAGGYSTDAVVQHTFALILNRFSRVAQYDRFVRDGRWIGSETFSPFVFPMQELAGKKLGIIGFGSIGRAVARVALAFSMRVLCFARTPRQADGVSFVPLETLLAESDIVSVHCPLNDDSRGMFNDERFAAMEMLLLPIERNSAAPEL